MNRIGWLDSARMPSHIHKTFDGGSTTVCGHRPRDMTKTIRLPEDDARWIIDPTIPRKIKGKSRYCRKCFANGGKTLPWIEK